MPVTWKQLSGFERAEKILQNIDGLSNEMIQAIYDEWSELEFQPTAIGIIQSEAELQRIATEHLLKKLGRWEAQEAYQQEILEAQRIS